MPDAPDLAAPSTCCSRRSRSRSPPRRWSGRRTSTSRAATRRRRGRATARTRPTRRGSGPRTRPDPTPMFSSNDKSRWATIRALVDDETYVIGAAHRIPTRPNPKEYKDEGIVAEPAVPVLDCGAEPGDARVLFEQAAADGDAAGGRILAAEARLRLGHRPRPLARHSRPSC